MDNVFSLIKKSTTVHYEGRVCIDSDWVPTGVTSQFLDNADTYHARYYNNDYWKYLIERAMSLSGVDSQAPMRVLDIGSGSGNSVFAAMDLMPNSIICANDISPQLLNILVTIQESIPHFNNRIEAYCFDLHKDFFSDNVFDIIVGGAIVHHLLKPEIVFKNVARWLRPGGKILLIEPLEVGSHIMNAIYLTLLAELEGVDSRLLSLFSAMCKDYEARFGIPKIKPWTSNLDDKWFLHHSYLKQLSDSTGLRLETISPISTNLEKIFTESVLGTINLAGLNDVAIPNKLLEVLNVFDLGISENLKKLFSPEGIIILSKD